MTVLALGLALFIGIHLLPSIPPLRTSLRTHLGARRYRALFSVLALVGLVLIVIGFGRAEFKPLWNPPAWGQRAALLLMFPALILFPAANMPSNIKRFTRHPMLWGTTLWALAHLLANGDLASLVLFGSLGAYALFDMVSATLRGAALSKVRQPLSKDLIVIAAGTTVYVALLFLHPFLFGAQVLPGG